MKRILGILLMILLLTSPFSSVYALETPQPPQQDNFTTNEEITEYNKQVDDYNIEVTKYNDQVDEDYANDYAQYEEEKAAVEANNTFVDNVENKVETDTSEARGFENNTTSTDNMPTDWSDEESENLKTIQIEQSENPSGEKIKVINVHVYLDEDADGYSDLDPTFYNTIEDREFELSENIKNHAVLTEWEVAEIDYDDTVTFSSEAAIFAGNIVWLNGKRSWFGANPMPYFLRSIDGYTQGYWTPGGSMIASTATKSIYGFSSSGETYTEQYAEKTVTSNYLYNGQPMTEEITVRTTDRQKPKNIFALFTYLFVRLTGEPEKQELPEEPVKGEYLSYLDKLDLLEEPVVEPDPVVEPEPTPQKPTPIVPAVITYGTGDPVVEDEPIEPTTTIIEQPTPKAAPEIGNWALLNLISAILSCLIAAILAFVKKKTDEEEEEYTDEEEKDIRGMKRFKIYSALVGIISIIVFILTEDMSLPMVLIDKWTILMVILLAVNIINIFIIKNKSVQEDEDNDEE